MSALLMKLNRLGFFAIIFIVISVVVIVSLLSVSQNKMKEEIELITFDNLKIAAYLYKIVIPLGLLVLVHMMPETKESWSGFAGTMQNLGYESLTIDLRGHGESAKGPNGFTSFSDAEHQAGIKDLEAAWKFLRSRGALPEKTVFIGASIGANLSMKFLAENPSMGGGVFLSAGNYKGIDSATLASKLSENQIILFTASKIDERVSGNNAEQNQDYYNLASQVKDKTLIIFDGAGHGTELFNLKTELDLTEAIKNLLNKL